jgi:Alcohol dehydrogenase GroES-like domain
MKGLVYHGPGQRAWEEVPDRRIAAPTGAIVRIDTATICGTDLHILKGDVPTCKPGTILGHEAVGTITKVGPAVTTVEPAPAHRFDQRPWPEPRRTISVPASTVAHASAAMRAGWTTGTNRERPSLISM